MDAQSLQQKILEKADNADRIAGEVISGPEIIPDLLDCLSSKVAGLRFKGAKVLRIISEKSPVLLYPHFDFFAALLDSDNSIIRWNAMDIIGNLTLVDSESRFEPLFEKFVASLDEGSLITAGHVVASADKIARSKPHLESRITADLLRVNDIPLPTDECRRIMAGHTITVFDKYFDCASDKAGIRDFVSGYLDCSRNSTRKKAEAFLKKHGADSDG